jgi:hypothetical protein
MKQALYSQYYQQRLFALVKQFPTHNMRVFFTRRLKEDMQTNVLHQGNYKPTYDMIKRCVIVQKMTYDDSKQTVVDKKSDKKSS